MKLSRLIELLEKARALAQSDPEVVLFFEPTALEDGFDWKETEGISDIRLGSDWPLPGKSMITHEGTPPSKVVIFYDNHFNLDSSTEPDDSDKAEIIEPKKPALAVGQTWERADGAHVVIDSINHHHQEEQMFCADGYWYRDDGKAHNSETTHVEDVELITLLSPA